jgi:predicted MPP superfamily phosphohydrolase
MSCSSISVQTYNLKTPLLEEKSIIKIALVSDLHSTIYGTDQSVLVDMIKNFIPDLIVLTGDIYCHNVSMSGTSLFLSGISGLAPVFYVTGNHEYMSLNMEAIRHELASFDVTILSDSFLTLEINENKIILAGIEDPYKIYETPDYNQNETMETVFRELDEIPLYKILLAHRPELIGDYMKFSFCLVLSGHAHGGQIRIPYILNGFYAPNQGFFPKYAGGIYNHGNLTHIVSRGLSVNPALPRIFNPPELVFIILEGIADRSIMNAGY